MASISPTIWEDVLGYLRVHSPDLMRAWFDQLEPQAASNGVLLVRARNAAQLKYLRQHCQQPFSEAAQAATGRLVTVEFEVSESGETAADDPSLQDPLDGVSDIPLNADFTFGNLVTGPFNRLAHAAAVAVATSPGRAYNPLFIHGDVGLGKTHLLQAICADAAERHNGLVCCYLSCEKFINHFISAVERGELNRFRHVYRRVEVLVIDDIQFLAEGERSREEFFHTFNALHQTGRQIVLSADSPPSEIRNLEERLSSRFNCGLVTMVEKPDVETRMAIVRKKARLRCIEVPEEVVELIATQVTSNTRELEGAITRVDAHCQTLREPITLASARAALGEPGVRILKIPTIMDVVTREFDVKVSDLQSKRRSRAVALPRHVYMYLARKLTSHSLEEIGGYVGGRDHSTVLHSIRAVEDLMVTDPDLRAVVADLTRRLEGRKRDASDSGL